jgi:micrococcal nuclease
VVGVVDGDTLKFLVADQRLLRVRFAFCDAPEKKQAYGARAKKAMSELVIGKDIDLRATTTPAWLSPWSPTSPPA